MYSNTLKSQGFLINSYDRCIANSTIKYKQCTIAWYVDKNKVSHVHEEVNTKVIETISEIFWQPHSIKGGETQVPGDVHRVLIRWKFLFIYEGLHVGIN